MNTEALLRTTTHPPCSQEQETLEISVPTDRSTLSVSDRLALRVGLWLLLRAERTRDARGDLRPEQIQHLLRTSRSVERDRYALLTYDAQRLLR